MRGRSVHLIGWGFSAIVGGLGCSDMLGLGELSYVTPESGGSQSELLPSAGGSGDGNALVGAGGDRLGEIPDPVPDYPAVDWSEESILVAAAPVGASSRYYRYEPAAHQLITYDYSATAADLQSVRAWGGPSSPQMSHVVALRDRGQDVLIGYDQVTGFREQVRNAEGPGPLEVQSNVANSGFTHFIAVTYEETWFTLAYDAHTGDYSWVPAVLPVAEVTTPVTNGYGNWGPGWRELRGYSWEGGSGVLLLREGLLALRRFPESSALAPPGGGMGGAMDDPFGLSEVASFSLEGLLGVPSTFEVVWVQGVPLLFFYAPDSGLVEVWQLEESPGGWSLVKNEDFVASSDGAAGKIRRDLSSLAFLSTPEQVHAITFDGLIAAERTFGPDGDVIQVR